MSETLPFECSYEHACRIEPDYECANTNCELNPMRDGDWSFGYYDHHGERHGLGFGDSTPPAYFEVTHHPTEKQLRYYADRELEQRYQQLGQVARCLYFQAFALRAIDLISGGFKDVDKIVECELKKYSDQLKAMGVSLDD